MSFSLWLSGTGTFWLSGRLGFNRSWGWLSGFRLGGCVRRSYGRSGGLGFGLGFWALVESLLPDYKARRALLRNGR